VEDDIDEDDILVGLDEEQIKVAVKMMLEIVVKNKFVVKMILEIFVKHNHLLMKWC
jgi:hypothetical protein